MTAVERGIMPHSIAMEISRASEADVQRALAEAYESGSLPGNQVLAIRRIIEARNVTGKAIHVVQGGRRGARQVTALTLVRSYRKETERQKLLIRKAALAQGRLVFIVNALRRLFADENFNTLLRAEGIATVPKPLAERIELLES